MELRNFPMDRQSCPLILGSCEYFIKLCVNFNVLCCGLRESCRYRTTVLLLIFFLLITDAYTSGQLIYEWQEGSSVNFVPGMALSQFDLMGSPYRNLTFLRREGQFSVLQVSFNLQRHTGYFIIQVIINHHSSNT